MSVNHQPKDQHTVTPYLIVNEVDKLISFLKNTFDAKETERMERSDGSVMHAEVKVGDSTIMIGGATGNYKQISSMLYIFVKDVDATFQKALDNGALTITEPEDQFYGDRNAGVKGPCGNSYWIATRIEDVSSEEIKKRQEKYAKQQAS